MKPVINNIIIKPGRIALGLSLSLLLGTAAMGQTTQPVSGIGSNIPLDVRATAAFNEGQYALALPLLQSVLDSATPMDDQRIGSLQEEIRVCKTNIANGVTAAAIPAQQTIATSAETRAIHKIPPAGTTLEISIKELGNFDYDQEKGGNIPADVKALGGTKLRLRGYMIPMDQAENITQFALVPSLFSCCFGQPPQIQHTVVVNCPKGKAVEYCPDEIVVEGNLSVDEKKDDGFIVSIFEIACTSVRPAPK
jgi:hypothetical protein